jgi:hypothetical protein
MIAVVQDNLQKSFSYTSLTTSGSVDAGMFLAHIYVTLRERSLERQISFNEENVLHH